MKKGHLAKDKVIELLEEHLAQPLDAHELLASALKRAKGEGKRVIVQETATWCGPCHMLSKFLYAHPVWQKDYILVKMDHRWTGAREIMKDFRQGAEGGIPWFAVLDSGGKVLATSNHAQSGENIGYPSDEPGRQHFRAMLLATRERLTDEDIAGLIRALGE